MLRSLVGSEMCIRDRYPAADHMEPGGRVSETQLEIGTVVHLCWTVEPFSLLQNTSRIYINATEVSTTSRGSQVPSSLVTAPLRVGHYDGVTTSMGFHGRIYAVSLYSRALGTAEVAEHFVSSFSQPANHVALGRWFAGATSSSGWGVFLGHHPRFVITADGDGWSCLLYTSDAADEEDSVDLGGRRIIKKKKKRVCKGQGRRT
eukprot:TRINITY_DN10071_c0_g1_i10.p1 TRINITY_DN10071_c0_g1~~TRINITY_DN10071_c0_g1_i10.p1  ORF type:complete len:204 (-),score=44.69 TRINITY_DN10071_c0_g1_i10:29-640(-)